MFLAVRAAVRAAYLGLSVGAKYRLSLGLLEGGSIVVSGVREKMRERGRGRAILPLFRDYQICNVWSPLHNQKLCFSSYSFNHRPATFARFSSVQRTVKIHCFIMIFSLIFALPRVFEVSHKLCSNRIE